MHAHNIKTGSKNIFKKVKPMNIAVFPTLFRPAYHPHIGMTEFHFMW